MLNQFLVQDSIILTIEYFYHPYKIRILGALMPYYAILCHNKYFKYLFFSSLTIFIPKKTGLNMLEYVHLE